MKLERQLKIALGETRLLILGSQVLFGFQFTGIFQDAFDRLPLPSRWLICSGLTLIMLTVALLITPSMQHRIVERGQASPAVLSLTTLCAGLALLPLAVALAADVFVGVERSITPAWGVFAGAGFFGLAVLCWYGLEYAFQPKRGPMPEPEPPAKPTPLEAQVEQLLTEARIIIPGCQALLGFQLSVTLMQTFERLPPQSKLAHAVALCCVGLTVILLMAPASLHRITFGGQDDPQFLKIGSTFVLAAPIPLAFGIALDTYVAGARALESRPGGAALAGTAAFVLLGLWYAFPLWGRLVRGPRER
ncbi:MAG TPA: DUF6328 family protein [Xanthobacteraceae bacterium]|jgi:hypothetical protein